MNNTTILNAENMTKLVSILAKYDAFAQFIDDYEQYGAATEANDMVAIDFINTANQMGIMISNETFEAIAACMTKDMSAENAIRECLTTQANNKEEKKMKTKNDYTMGGAITAKNWTEFKAVCKEYGINCGTDTFAILSQKLSAILSAKTEPAVAKEFVVTQKMGDAIIRRIRLGGKDRNGKTHSPAMFMATKSKDPETNGKYMVTMAKLYAIIADVYGLKKDEPGNDEFIKKNVINYLCKNGWLVFKRYETGALSFFPTVKMRDYKFE